MKQISIAGLLMFIWAAGGGDVAARVPQDPRGITLTSESSGRREALVIGNAAYRVPLTNPKNDAIDISAALTKLEFHVTPIIDATYVEFVKAVDRFMVRINRGDIALVYYAGHGIQVDGENYLLPVDFDLPAGADVATLKYLTSHNAYSAALLHDRLDERGARLKILILDACRNNPFRASRAIGGDGLAAMTTPGIGSFIAFATGPNSTADDNSRGRNGLFTTYVLEALTQPGLALGALFDRVREGVVAASGRRQIPWVNSNVIGQFFFVPPLPTVPAPVSRGSSAVTRTMEPNEGILNALRAYRSAYQSKDVDALRRVFPSLGGANPDELKRTFADLKVIAVAMNEETAEIKMAPDGNTATASCVHRITFTSQAGRDSNTPGTRAEFHLKKQGEIWIIESRAFK